MSTLSYHRAGIHVRATTVQPGTALSFASGSEVKKIVKAGRWFSLAGLVPAAGLQPPDEFNVERPKNTAF
jgi:hypothetical protein